MQHSSHFSHYTTLAKERPLSCDGDVMAVRLNFPDVSDFALYKSVSNAKSGVESCRVTMLSYVFIHVTAQASNELPVEIESGAEEVGNDGMGMLGLMK